MKSFGTYISKHLASFAAFLLILVIVNVVLYGVTFYHTVSEDYGEASPRAMLELTSTAATTEKRRGPIGMPPRLKKTADTFASNGGNTRATPATRFCNATADIIS